MGPNLQHVANTSPITSLAFHTSPNTEPLLLAGEGPFVKVLETSGLPLTKSHRIFARERIHGITLSPTAPQVLFWGGRSISITSITSLLALQCPPLREIAVLDWVFYACFLPSTHGGIPRVAVITAHNSLMLFSPYSGWTELAAEERCMLYSAHLLYLPSESNSDSGQDERILVAAGTVFGEILIWSTTLTNTDEKGKSTLHYRLLGHEGSIFGVNISPIYPGGKRYLASCSDDRTVRVWDISQLPVSSSKETNDGQTKNTGFSHTSETTPTPGVACVSLGWGHTARIWGVRFLPEPTVNGEIRLLSISEDLTSKFWSFNPEITATTPQLPEKTDTELRNTATYQLHSGKHLWSYALHVSEGLLATGGADGRVGLVEYNDLEEGQDEVEWDMTTVLLNVLGEEDATEPKDTFKAYAVLDSDRFLVTTSQGRLLTYNLSTKGWRLVASVDSLKNWSILASWQDEGMIALGNGSGQIGVCCVDTGREWWWSAGGESAQVAKTDKVGGVWTSAGVKRGDTLETKTYYILTTSLVTGTFTLHAFTRSDEDLDNRTTTILTPPLENGTKKFLVTSMCIDYASSLLFLGSRNGAVAIYKLSGALRGCWQGIHDVDAVTSITPLPGTTETRVLTAGRNGGYTVLSFSEGAKTTMTVLHAVKPTVCTVIEGATRERVLYGFRGKHFFVWDEVQACEIAAVECGGSHRAWAFYWPGAGQEQKEGWLVWTKASKIRIARTPLARRRVLQKGLHGREIKALAYSSETGVLATGAEDTVVRLSTVSEDTGEVAAVTVVKRHTTGVQHLVWSPCGRWLFSSGGVGEFFVWRVRKIDDGLGVVEEAKCEVAEDGGDLRICGFDVVGVYEEKAGEVVGFVIGMVYSDSSVKIYHYNLSTKTFTLLIAGAYKTCCLLHAHFIVLPTSSPTLTGRLLLLVTATDGFITAYELTDLLPEHQLSPAHSGHLIFTPLTLAQKKKNKKKKQQQRKNSTAGGTRALPQPALTTRVHQSGIKALTLALSPSHITIYSGGDDCALAITRVPLTSTLGPAESFVLPRAHASAVAALALLGDRVLSVGVDQVVNLWSVSEDEGKMGLRLQDEVYTPVADVAGAVVLGGGLVLVGGVGVDVWRVV